MSSSSPIHGEMEMGQAFSLCSGTWQQVQHRLRGVLPWLQGHNPAVPCGPSTMLPGPRAMLQQGPVCRELHGEMQLGRASSGQGVLADPVPRCGVTEPWQELVVGNKNLFLLLLSLSEEQLGPLGLSGLLQRRVMLSLGSGGPGGMTPVCARVRPPTLGWAPGQHLG